MTRPHASLAGLVLILVVPSGRSLAQESQSIPVGEARQGPSTEPQRVAIHRSAGLFELGPGVLHGGGAAYDVRFTAAGMRFEPALGAAVSTTQHVSLTPIAVGRGGEAAASLPSGALPEQHERSVVFRHGAGVRERYAVGVDGVELSWVFDQRPGGWGDLVVRYAVETELPGPMAIASGGLGFGLDGIGGVTIGVVRGVDAAGREVAGALRYDRGVLELSLPSSFVERAAYPLVLDPLIGTKFSIWGGSSYDDAQPDCAYESTHDRYLVTFLRTFSSSDVRVRAQLVDRVGGLFQGVIWITTSGLSFPPRVASFSRGERFGVVWAQNVSNRTVVFFRSVSSLGGPSSMSPASTIASSVGWTIRGVDIGSEAGAINQSWAFKAVWHDANDGRIHAARIGIDASGGTVLHAAHTVFSDSTFNAYSDPAIARGAESNGKLMVVVRRFASIGPQRGITSALVSARDDTVTSVRTIVLDSTNDYGFPDVDGRDDEWVVTWREHALGASQHAVSARSAARVAGVVQLGPIVSVGGTSLVQADSPSVGYSRGKTWLGYRARVFGTTSLRARGIDSVTCQNCRDEFSEPITTADARIVVATTSSGNDPLRNEGLIVWGEDLDIWAQRVANHGNGGSVTNLGGGCGAGGTQSADVPSIGRNQIFCSLGGLSSTAGATMLNLTLPTPPFTCGPCAWLPPMVALSIPITPFRNATFGYALPCDPMLVGARFETQWTTFDPSTAPCAILPGFAISDRLEHTIGQ